MSIKKASSPKNTLNMDFLLESHIKSGNFRHGYLLAGNPAVSKDLAFKAANILLGIKEKPETHPDFFFKKYESFGIGDSREMISKASVRPFFKNKVFILEISYFSTESANALLKTLEEPSEGNYFFIITSSREDIIPTLRSRLSIVNIPSDIGMSEERKKFCENFLKDLPQNRLKTIKKLLKKGEEKEKAIEFLNELEFVLHESRTFTLSVLEQISQCRDFLYQKGGSPKMVLEHIALILPQVI